MEKSGEHVDPFIGARAHAPAQECRRLKPALRSLLAAYPALRCAASTPRSATAALRGDPGCVLGYTEPPASRAGALTVSASLRARNYFTHRLALLTSSEAQPNGAYKRSHKDDGRKRIRLPSGAKAQCLRYPERHG